MSDGLSKMAKAIKESPTLKLNALAASLIEKGEPVIHLGGGEPKAQFPVEALEKCTSYLAKREVRYAPPAGIPALKKVIVRYTEQIYKKTVKPECVVVSVGGKQAIMAVLHGIVDPQEEVLFPAPYWVSFPDMATLAGGVPIVVRPQSDPFRPTLKEVEAKVTARTRAIILNSPNNPSGIMYSRDFIAGMVAFCEEKDLYLLMDDTYNRLVFDGKAAPNPYEFAKKPLEESKMVVFNSVSKTYAMPGFRIGWAIGNPALIKAASNIQSQQTSCAAVPSQWAAVGALEGDQSGVEALRATLEKHRNAMLEGLKDFPKLKVTKPDATFYCFPDFSAYDKDSGKLAEFLLDKARVLVVPGKEFGMDGHLRLSYCGSAQDVTEGVARIRWALDPGSPREIVIGGKKAVRDWK